jgi:predicted CXXCH cytochrome family protein
MATSPHIGVTWVRHWRRGLLAAGIGLVLLGSFALWKRDSGPPPASIDIRPTDPRLQYAGPFQNIHPEVRYVGDARCADCHDDIVRTYHQHPMARSLLPLAETAQQPPLDEGHHNPFAALDRRFQVERRGERVWHRQELSGITSQSRGQQELEVHYVIGSGMRGYSYLTNHDGFLFQTPISWYSQKQCWDLSPGFREGILPGRPVGGMCLFCHAHRAQSDEDSENHYQEPIFLGHGLGCERCHGPGERHVDNPGRRDPKTGVDYTIVNPRHLEPALREAVCEQCHLAGEARLLRRGRKLYDFRPGLPLGQFWSIFVHAREPGQEDKAVNHVEQMHLSRCFQDSAGKMGCLSCHDPHVAVGPEQRVAHYRARCLACHQQDSCSLPSDVRRHKQADDSCIACHMPRYGAADIVHTAATNHRIVRQAPSPAAPKADKETGRQGDKEKEKGASAFLSPPLLVSLSSSFVPFERTDGDRPEVERQRDLGIALVQLIFWDKLDLLSCPLSPLPLLEQAVQYDPDDVDAWEAKGGALLLQRRYRESLAAFETVLVHSPRREKSLARAAGLAKQLLQREAARRYWQQAVAVNPWMANYRHSLALLLAEQEAWEDCRQQCEAWLRLDPTSAEARTLLARCQARTRRPPDGGGAQR